MEKEQNTVELTRSMYKEIKSMNRDQMQQVLTNIYDQGAKSVEHGAIEFEKLREEIGKINGILYQEQCLQIKTNQYKKAPINNNRWRRML